MKKITNTFLLFTALFYLSACDDNPTEPKKTTREYDSWLPAMIDASLNPYGGYYLYRLEYDGNDKKPEIDYSQFGIDGFNKATVEALDGLFLDTYTIPAVQRYPNHYFATTSIFRDGVVSDMRYKVKFEGISLDRYKEGFYYDASNYTYDDRLISSDSTQQPVVRAWNIETPDKKIIEEKMTLVHGIYPDKESFKNISLRNGGRIKWNADTSNSTVTLRLTSGKFPERFVDKTFRVPDSGEFFLKHNDLSNAGITPGDTLICFFSRGKFYSEEFAEIKKKFGFVTKTVTEVWFRINE